jgi:ankyrin repeat protein
MVDYGGEEYNEEDYANEYDDENDKKKKNGTLLNAESEEALFDEIFSILIDKLKISHDLRDNKGRTALHWAAKAKNLRFIELTLRNVAK